MQWVVFSGIVADKSAIQFKMLNLSKGPAMWSPRTQNDRMKFAEEWRYVLENTPNLDFFQDMVKSLIINNGKVEGVITSLRYRNQRKICGFNQWNFPKWPHSRW